MATTTVEINGMKTLLTAVSRVQIITTREYLTDWIYLLWYRAPQFFCRSLSCFKYCCTLYRVKRLTL